MLPVFRKLSVLLIGLSACIDVDAATYREPWRPQFHFSPATNWMNDPNGMVFYDGEYHLFYQYNPFGIKWGHMSWGHAVSKDLVHWQHLPVALLEENGVMIFSGSAVVDWKNTSGFGRDGKPPMIAIYTGHYTGKPLQNQHIAYSTDRGRTWTKFAGNPVLDIGDKDFRDPKVFWHEPTEHWVMVVAWPVHRKVRFYASKNLKEWSHLSDFGPAGSTKGIWECPDLFPVPAENGGASKWTLIVNVGSGAPAGGSGCQYFVGHFDGKTFTLDPSYPKAQEEFVPDGKLLADFESDDYGQWESSGEALGKKPANGTLPKQQKVSGFRGRGLVNTYLAGDGAQGTLTSPEFEISHSFISFLIGGGSHAGQTCMNLLVDGRTAKTAAGDSDERLSWKSWDVQGLRGKKARIEIVDRHTGGWGHVNVDHIVMANEPARPAKEAALWADYGRDFYAAVSWSDIPKEDGRRLWLGWMSNWEYANDVPTSPWRSAMSAPRELLLRQTRSGTRLVQKPVRELAQLRTKAVRFGGGSATAANAWLRDNLGAADSFELKIAFSGDAAGVEGLKLFKGKGEETVIGIDRGASRVFLDRTKSGKTDFNPKFAGTHEAPLDGNISALHILVDTSSVEVFVNDGEVVLTDLVLPSPESRGIELVSPREGKVITSMEAWTLRSSWK